MESKLVKFEIGKVLAVVLSIIVVAGVATALLSSGFFKGLSADIDYGQTCGESPVSSDCEEYCDSSSTDQYANPSDSVCDAVRAILANS